MKNNRYWRLLLGVFLLTALLVACDDENVATETATGMVWSDDNHNGIRDGAEKGIPNVTVRIIAVGIRTNIQTKTDADGNYELAVVVSERTFVDGTFEIEIDPVDSRSFTDQNVGDDPADDLDPRDDSDVNKITGRAKHVSGWWVDAGLLPSLVVEAPEPVPNAPPESDAPPAATDTVTNTVKTNPMPEPSPTPPPPSYTIFGSVYEDVDKDSHYLELAGDELLPGVTVELVDAHDTDVLVAKTVTNSIGEYSFQIFYEQPVKVLVIKPPELDKHVFGEESEGRAALLPVGVDNSGYSLWTEFEPNDSHAVNAALQPPEAAVEVGAVSFEKLDSLLQNCATGEVITGAGPSNATIVRFEFVPLPQQSQLEEVVMIVTTAGAASAACTSLDLLNPSEPLPERIPEWFFSAAANDTSGGLCNGETFISRWGGSEWVQTQDDGASIIREGAQVTFSYPAEWFRDATHLYIGGVDFNVGMCTQLGLNQNGVGSIPLDWNIDHWGAPVFGNGTLGFELFGMEMPFQIAECTGAVNIRQNLLGDGSPQLFPTLEAIGPANLSFTLTLQNGSGQPFANGCDNIFLNGTLDLEIGGSN